MGMNEMNLLRQLIGALTIPKSTVSIFGSTYISCEPLQPKIEGNKVAYKYRYQELEQSRFLGVWVKQNSWILSDNKYDKVESE